MMLRTTNTSWNRVIKIRATRLIPAQHSELQHDLVYSKVCVIWIYFYLVSQCGTESLYRKMGLLDVNTLSAVIKFPSVEIKPIVNFWINGYHPYGRVTRHL